MYRAITTIATVLGMLLTLSVRADEEPAKPATLEELQSAIARVVAENDVPAVGIALVDDSGPFWVRAIGKADIEDDVDADEDSMFRIGSTSKMFVSLSVLKLVEEGRLSLDDKLADLAPDIAFENQWEANDPVRVVHLLEHTTGWDDIHLPEYAHNDPAPATLKEGLDYHPHSRVSRWKPGSRMSYCNAGPPVAAYIVERVTGQEYESYVQENFFAPMGMETMTYRLSEDFRERGVTLYANGNQPQDYWHIIMRPSGSINASAKDMARLVAFFINRGAVEGRQLVSAASVDRMETTVSTSGAQAGQEIGYGLSNYASPHEHWIYRAHDGGVNGGITEMAYLPEARAGHAIMINSDDGESLREISRLVRDFETRSLEQPSMPDPVEVTADHRAIEGLYYPINARQQVGYFLGRVLGLQKFWFEEGTLRHKPLLGGDENGYYPVAAAVYASEETGATSLSLVVDPLGGPVVHLGTLVLAPTSALLAYGQLGIAALWAMSILSSVVYFLVWGVRKLRGKVAAGATMSIRVWPLLASVSVLVLVGLFAAGMSDPFVRLGAPTAISVGILLSSALFALFAALGVATSVWERATPMNRVNYWHSTLASSVHLLVAVYLVWFGIVGLMTWA